MSTVESVGATISICLSTCFRAALSPISPATFCAAALLRRDAVFVGPAIVLTFSGVRHDGYYAADW